MARNTWIGVAAVALVGGLAAIALSATLGPGPAPPVERPAPVPEASPPRAALPAPSAEDPLASPPSMEIAEATGADPDALPPGFDQPPAVDAHSPPPPTGVLREPYEDAQALIKAGPLDGLAPDASPEDFTNHVKDHVDEVHGVVMDLLRIAKEDPDSELADEALEQAASLYDRTADDIPLEPPPQSTPEAWASEHAALTGMLREKAAALRPDEAPR